MNDLQAPDIHHLRAAQAWLGMEADAEALEELDHITAYAHSLTPKRRVFVAVNTLIRHDELPELIEEHEDVVRELRTRE